MADVNPIPADYHRVSPYLCLDGAEAAIAFYRDVFGAVERLRMAGPDGRIGHAELEIGSSIIMLADEYPDMGYLGPKSVGGTPVTIQIYVDDVDAVFARATAGGATETRAVENQFYGDRSGQFLDPFGHRWNVASHVEDVSPDDMASRAAELAAGG